MLINFENFIKINEDIAKASKLDKIASNKIRRCFTQIMSYYGFFADLFFQLKIMEAHASAHVDTMATDGKAIAYNADFVKKLTEEQINFVLIHEVMHNANFHFQRQGTRKAIVTTSDGKKSSLWNWATDYAINLQIDDMRKEPGGTILSPPPGILLDRKYEDLSAEQIYDLLLKEIPHSDPEDGDGDDGDDDGDGEDGEDGKDGEGGGKGKSKKPGKPGQGKGQGKGPGQGKDPVPGVDDIREPGSLGEQGDPLDGYEGNGDLAGAKDSGEINKMWGEILDNAKSKNAGTGSPSLDRWFNKIGKPKVNWKRRLLKFMNQCFASQPKYGYFNKKFIGGNEYLPGMKYPKQEGFRQIVLIIDTSGSIGQDTLTKFASEFYGIFTTKKILETTVIWCDDRIQKVEQIQTKDKSGATISKAEFETKFLQRLKPRGQGGTSFIPPFKWIEENILKRGQVPSFVVYFTDAAGSAPDPRRYGIPKYRDKVLWVITDCASAPHIQFPEKIFIDKNPEGEGSRA